MAEYIIEIPDEYLPEFYGHMAYYPSELHDPMKITPLVRCEDCKHHEEMMGGVCEMWGFLVGSQGFCSWGERREDE